MALCGYCKTQETQLYDRGIPICVKCEEAQSKPKRVVTDPLIRTKLLQDVNEWIARIQDAKNDLEAVKTEANGFPTSDGTQHIQNAARRLADLEAEYAKAHTRLARYFSSGIEPEE